MVHTGKDEVCSVAFPTVDPCQNISIPNLDAAMCYLIPDTVTLPPDASQLTLTQIIYTSSPYDSVGLHPTTEFIDFEVEYILQSLTKGDSLSVVEHFSDKAGKFNSEQKKVLDISGLANQTVVIKPRLRNIKIDSKNLIYGAGDVWLEQKTLPKPAPQLPGGAYKHLPQHYQLYQNFPNPFNAATEIRYQLPEDCQVRLAIYTVLGQHIRTLVDQRQAAGDYAVNWDGKDGQGQALASGIYVYQIKAGSLVTSRKLTLIR